MDVAELREGIEGLTAQVATQNPGGLPAVEAERLLEDAVRLRNVAEHVAALAARRIGQTGAHRRTGDRSEAHYLARVSGGWVGGARRALATLGRLDELDATREAVARGELSPRQVGAIPEAAVLDPAAEARLLRLAASRSIGQLEEECARVRAAAAPKDEEERHRGARRNRGCWQRKLDDGSAEIRDRSSADEVAEAWAVVNAYRERRFRDLAADAPREGFDAHMADGFLDALRAAAGVASPAPRAGHDAPASTTDHEPALPLPDVAPPAASLPAPSPAKVVVRIDWDALVRGHPISGEVSEIAGLGPVPVSVVRGMLRTGDPFVAAVVTKGVDVVSVAHLGRKPTAHQRTALEWLDMRCRAEGCDRTMGLEVDHRVPWAESKVTLLALLDWLCTHHHDLKSHQGWALVDGHGTRPFVAPDDPRHPSRAGPGAA